MSAFDEMMDDRVEDVTALFRAEKFDTPEELAEAIINIAGVAAVDLLCARYGVEPERAMKVVQGALAKAATTAAAATTGGRQ